MTRQGKSAIQERDAGRSDHEGRERSGIGNYLRFGAMIATATVAMYILTYVNTFEASHVRWSETRLYMALLMGACMAVIMLLFMVGMYRNVKANVAIVVASIGLFVLATFLVRTQVMVQDRSYMSAMIPHHSIAILTSEHAEIGDVRVCELAVAITEAQRREIKEMEWLIDDIGRHGVAGTTTEAEERPVPTFEGSSQRTCR